MTSISPPAFKPTNWGWGLAALTIAGLLFVPLARAWELAPDLGHGWAAPILMAYLWWERWSARPTVTGPEPKRPLAGWVIAVVACALVLSVPLRLLLTIYPVWPMVLALHVAILVGLTLWVAHRHFGARGMRWVGGPLVLLPGVLPWPGVIERAVIAPIRQGIAMIVTEASNLMGHPALASGTTIKLANGWVGIDEACGGIRSLQAAVTTALFFGAWLRLSVRRRIALVGVGVLAAMGGNLGRIGFLSWCATGPEGRLDQWHDQAGWVALGFSLILTGWIGSRWGRTDGKVAPRPPVRHTGGTPPIAGSRLSRGALGLLGALVAIEAGTRLWYAAGDHDIAADTPLWTLRPPTQYHAFQENALPDYSREILQPDAFFSATWTGVDGVRRMLNYVEWHEGQAARSLPFLHNPTQCLPYAGAELVTELGPIEVTWTGGSLPFQTFVFRQFNRELVVAFTIWDPQAAAPLDPPNAARGWGAWMQRQWADVATAQIHQPAQMLAFAIEGRENQDRLGNEIARLIGPTANFGRWQRSPSP